MDTLGTKSSTTPAVPVSCVAGILTEDSSASSGMPAIHSFA